MKTLNKSIATKLKSFCNSNASSADSRLIRSRRDTTLGPNEQATMLALLQRGNHAYGSEINKEISVRTGHMLSVGVLYNTLDRLVRKGLIEPVSAENQSTSASNLGKKETCQYFKVTGKGVSTLECALQFIDKMRGRDGDIASLAAGGAC